MLKPFLFSLVCVFFCQRTNAQVAPPFTKGVYGDASAFFKDGVSLRSLGINAIFVHRTSLRDELYNTAKEEGVRIYVEFPTLNGKEYLEEHPEAWPINEKGERAPIADWFMGICPTDSGFRQYREQQLRDILGRYQVDGIWLDYVHWHAQFETPNPILPETCFCERCILRFQNEMHVGIPVGSIQERALWILTRADSSWRLWRTRVVNDWVSHLKSILKKTQPSALLGIYYCPWYPEDYGGAGYRTLGLDVEALAKIADVFSPMLYHHMMGRPPAWVGEYVKWLQDSVIGKGRALIWPIVQAHNKPGVITTEEFREVMWNGSRAPSTGIMMFTLHSLIGEPGKLEVMKDLYRKR